MKKVILLILSFALSVASFSQTDPIFSHPLLSKDAYLKLAKDDYLKKSKDQKRAAWIMLGMGPAFLSAGIFIPEGRLMDDGTYRWEKFKAECAGMGISCFIGCVSAFISSSKNHKKAMRISFKNERSPQIYKSSFVYKPVPSLTLKISL